MQIDEKTAECARSGVILDEEISMYRLILLQGVEQGCALSPYLFNTYTYIYI